MSDFTNIPEANKGHPKMEPIDFAELRRNTVHGMHNGAGGPIKVQHTKRKQMDNDRALHGDKTAHPLDKYLDGPSGVEEPPYTGKIGRNLWEDVKHLPIEERLAHVKQSADASVREAFERGFLKRAEQLGLVLKEGGVFAKSKEGLRKVKEYALKHPWLAKGVGAGAGAGLAIAALK